MIGSCQLRQQQEEPETIMWTEEKSASDSLKQQHETCIRCRTHPGKNIATAYQRKQLGHAAQCHLPMREQAAYPAGACHQPLKAWTWRSACLLQNHADVAMTKNGTAYALQMYCTVTEVWHAQAQPWLHGDMHSGHISLSKPV